MADISGGLNAKGELVLTFTEKGQKRLLDAIEKVDTSSKSAQRTLDSLGVAATSSGKSASNAATGIKKMVAEYQSFQRVRSMDSKAGPVNQQFTLLQQRIKSEVEAAKAQERMYDSLPRARYALYDVARTYTMVSTAALGAATAVATVGIAFQKDFAQVERTTGVAGAAVGELRRDLEDLTTTIPESFSNISGIAALGGQLGIAADGIDEFTETTAKLTATTDLSADAAGTALGRFQALMGVPSSQFENLASSILKVGINSVATETQIVQIATQISSMGNFAGMTADQVVGLAGALASTGTQPELARGTVTRLFTLMSQAVAGTTDKLDEFARVSGVSAEEFRASWGTEKFAAVFQKFLRGIGSDGREALDVLSRLPEETILAADSFEELGIGGNNAVQTLRDLGITSVRDVPALLRLADAGQVVGDAFSDAATGFAEGTELNEQYAKIAETVAAKLTTLGNTLKTIMATIADDSALNLFGKLLNVAQGLAGIFLEIARNPVGKVVLGVVTAFTALIGVYAAVKAAQMLMTASLFAMVTAQRELAKTALEANISVRQLGMSMFFTGGAGRAGAAGATTFKTALRGVGLALGPVGIALTALSVAFEVFSTSSTNAADRAEQLFGGSEAIASAIRADTEAVKEGAEAIGTRTVALSNATGTTNDHNNALGTSFGLEGDLKSATDDATESIKTQTVALGENLKMLQIEGFMADDAFKEFWVNRGNLIEETGFKLDTWITKSMESEGGGEAYLRGFLSAAEAQWATAYGRLLKLQSAQKPDPDVIAAQETLVNKYRDQADSLQGLLGDSEALDSSISAGLADLKIYGDLMGEAGTQAGGAAEQIAGLSQEMIDASNAIMAGVNASIALENAMFSLGASIAENGLDFSQVTEAGRANLGVLMQVINAVMAETAANGGSAADAIAGLMQALSAMGVNVAQDLAFLSDMVAALGGATGAGGLNTAMLDAIRGMERGFGSVVPKAAQKSQKAVNDVAKAVKTVADYASELGKVFDDAFQFRFGKEIAKDATKDLWKKWKDDIRAAKDRAKELRLEIRGIKAEQASLTARKSLLTYQLGVARRYGDSLSEERILAEIGEVDVDLAENKQDLKEATKELKDVQDELKVGLEGNSEAARNQRERIRELVKSYQDQMEEAARNGASQKELKELSEKLKKEFEDQAEKVGLSKEEIEKYKGAFDDMEEIVDKVPRDVTTDFKANMSPAEKALKNWKDKLDAERKKIEKPFKLNAKFNSKIDSNLTGLKAAQQALAEALKAQAKAYKDQPGGGTRVDYWDNKVNYWRKILGAYKGYAAGGFTGRGGKYDAAGTVHRGEFVFPKEYVNQSSGLPYANVLGSMAHALGAGSGARGGGNEIQLVELLPNQLDQLARAVSARVSIDGRVVASVSNGYNSAQQARGAG